MNKYGPNPAKDQKHILIFDGRLSGNMEESDNAKKLFKILDSKGLNPIIYSDNDTVNFTTMQKILFIDKENKEGFEKSKNDAVKYKIPFHTLKDSSEIENYCSSL